MRSSQLKSFVILLIVLVVLFFVVGVGRGTKYSCDVILENSLFFSTKMEAQCGVSGSCFSSLLGKQAPVPFSLFSDEGVIIMNAGGVMVEEKFSVRETSKQEYSLSVCGNTGAESVRLTLLDEDRETLDTQEFPIRA